MELHEFRLGGQLALTNDRTGAELPGNGWAFAQTLDFIESQPRIGASYKEVVLQLTTTGLYPARRGVDMPKGPRDEKCPAEALCA